MKPNHFRPSTGTKPKPKNSGLEQNADRAYESLCCRARLHRRKSLLVCPNCLAHYPIISGVPILVQQPERYLVYSMEQLLASRKSLEERAVRVEEMRREHQLLKVGFNRLRSVISAQLHLLRLCQKSLEPVELFLKHSSNGGQESARMSEGCSDNPGWQAEMLWPYLLRDWKCDKELESTVQVVSSALTKHVPRWSDASLLVSGCGAGGLLCHIGTGFSRVLGLDLCLPIIFLVRELLLGEQLDIKIPTASIPGACVTKTTIGGLKKGRSQNVELIIGDSCRTALPSGSIDCVITSFLIDLIEDPRELAAEIHRLLSDQGVWINYGPSGSLDADWYFDGVESSAFLKASGFSPLQLTNYRTTHLDRRELDEFASFEDHICYLFAAKKRGRPKWRGVDS